MTCKVRVKKVNDGNGSSGIPEVTVDVNNGTIAVPREVYTAWGTAVPREVLRY